MNTHIDGPEISAFLDGVLAESESARATDHFEHCSECRRELNLLRRFKRVLAASPRKTMPAELALSLEHRFVTPERWWHSWTRPTILVPAGALAAVGLAVSIWMNQARIPDEVPLEPLLAAHTRYSAESIVPVDNMVASAYSEQLTAVYGDTPDVDLE